LDSENVFKHSSTQHLSIQIKLSKI